MIQTSNNKTIGFNVFILLLLIFPFVSVSEAADSLPEFGDDTFKNCIFGTDMTCYGQGWTESDSSGAWANCGDVGASSQTVMPDITYYQNHDTAVDEFNRYVGIIAYNIDYYLGGCSNDDEICDLQESDDDTDESGETTEAGYLGYYSTNNRKVQSRGGEFVLLSENYLAHFTLYGNPDLMTAGEAMTYYNTAKACLKDIVNKDACLGVAIPLPEKREEYEIETPIPPGPVPGSDPEKISPVGLGSHASFDEATDDDALSVRVRLCPFEEPVDICVELNDFYTLNSFNQVTTYDQYRPGSWSNNFVWKKNVSGEFDEIIPYGFGGLFPNNRLPAQEFEMILEAYPAGADTFDNNTPLYSWSYLINVECDDKLPQPDAKRFFFVQSQAFPTTHSDPQEVNPLGFSTSAVGGLYAKVQADMCIDYGDDTYVDTYFGMYTFLSDPFNIYFINGDANNKGELFQKVPLLEFIFKKELPLLPWKRNQGPLDWPDDIMVGSTVELEGYLLEAKKRRSLYLYAITPTGVRDKFYAWLTPFHLYLKDAFESYWVTLGAME